MSSPIATKEYVYRVDKMETCSMLVNLDMQERPEMFGSRAHICWRHHLRGTQPQEIISRFSKSAKSFGLKKYLKK